jgi:hypothetical protein
MSALRKHFFLQVPQAFTFKDSEKLEKKAMRTLM